MLGNTPIFAYVPVADIERGRRFYEDVLDQKVQSELPGVGVTYQCADGTAFMMYKSPGAGTSTASTAFWTVKNIEKVVSGLKEREVTFEEYDFPGMNGKDSVYEGGGAKAAWFKDPDGNTLAIIEPVSSPA